MRNDNLSTKEEILTILKINGNLSANEISKKIGITEMAVRRHLNTLERDKLIESALARQTMGRPINFYYLTEKADNMFPKAYKNFAKEILYSILENEGSEKITEVFNTRKEKFKENFQKKMNGITNLGEKIKELVKIQNENGYMIELEELEDRYLIKTFNCPISAIASEFGQACESEKQLFNYILESEVKCTKCLTRGDKYCIFQIMKENISNV